MALAASAAHGGGTVAPTQEQPTTGVVRDPEPAPSSRGDAVAAVELLGRSPGASVVAVDAASGEPVASGARAADGALLGALRRLARSAEAVHRDAGAVEDLVVTTDAAFHLARRLPLGGPAGTWVHLRVDRDRGNLAVARRALAVAARLPTPPRAGVPAPRRAALPRRSAAAAPPPDRSSHPRPVGFGPEFPVPHGSWSTDVSTIRRVLAGLSRLT